MLPWQQPGACAVPSLLCMAVHRTLIESNASLHCSKALLEAEWTRLLSVPEHVSVCVRVPSHSPLWSCVRWPWLAGCCWTWLAPSRCCHELWSLCPRSLGSCWVYHPASPCSCTEEARVISAGRPSWVESTHTWVWIHVDTLRKLPT